jgi:hypothetical protein
VYERAIHWGYKSAFGGNYKRKVLDRTVTNVQAEYTFSTLEEE